MDRMYTMNQTKGDLMRDLMRDSKTDKAKQRGPELMPIKLGASDTPRKHTSHGTKLGVYTVTPVQQITYPGLL